MRNLKFGYSFLVLAVLFTLVVGVAQPVQAQTYSFEVSTLQMQVYVQPDASVYIVYDITFRNFGDPIDIVDIGTPHDDYDLGTMQASVNGVALSDIRVSEYVDPGVEVHLHEQAIPAGGECTLHFEFTMPDLVYQDTTRKGYASLQITPTWFDSSLVEGLTDVQIAIHMLPGVDPEALLYQKEPFTQKAIYDERAVALWVWEDSSAVGPALVGVSFPDEGMDRVIKMSILDLTVKWLEDNPAVRFVMGVILMVMLAFLFFRFSGGTGFSIFFVLAGIAFCLFSASPLFQLAAFPILGVLIIFNEWHVRRRRKRYLPAIAQVEGGGIKRGLTAPESAVLLEMPFGKVLTLVVFGLLSKGILRQVKDAPLTVEVVEAFRTRGNPELKKAKDREKFRRQVAQEKGTVIHKYEEPFLYLVEKHAGKPVKDIDFGAAVRGLITQTAAKMKGFDLSDTQDYYRRIVSRAWKRAQSLGELEAREQFLDNYLPWVMMNENYPTVLTWGGYNYWPRWVRSPRVAGVGSGKSSGSSSSKPSVGGRTTMGDVGASFAGWAESTMGALAGAVLPGSLNMPSAKGGVLDLSGADKVTGDVFSALMESSSSGGSSGGGGGGGCACACAGCACACACAGGGR